MSPAYTTLSESTVNLVMKRRFVMSMSLFYFQLASRRGDDETMNEALKDPEVALSFSNTYIKDGEEPPPVRILIMTPDAKSVYHFEVDLVTTREENGPREMQDEDGKILGKRHHFNEQVTHASHIKTEDGQGYVVCVNFEQPRILLLKDEPFSAALP